MADTQREQAAPTRDSVAPQLPPLTANQCRRADQHEIAECPACGQHMRLWAGFYRCPACGFKESCCF